MNWWNENSTLQKTTECLMYQYISSINIIKIKSSVVATGHRFSYVTCSQPSMSKIIYKVSFGAVHFVRCSNLFFLHIHSYSCVGKPMFQRVIENGTKFVTLQILVLPNWKWHLDGPSCYLNVTLITFFMSVLQPYVFKMFCFFAIQNGNYSTMSCFESYFYFNFM